MHLLLAGGSEPTVESSRLTQAIILVACRSLQGLQRDLARLVPGLQSTTSSSSSSSPSFKWSVPPHA